MGYAMRTRACSVCGQLVTGRLPPTAEIRCAECGISVLVAHIAQMAARCGPGYDRWKRSAGPMGRPRKNRQEA